MRLLKGMFGLNRKKKNKKKSLLPVGMSWLMLPFLHYQTLQFFLKLDVIHLIWV